MGAGKTTVGGRLADRLGWGFLDLDREIERQAGQSIRDIFQTDGEARFRERESKALEALVAETALIVATGGGVVVRPANRDFMARVGGSVWIDPPFEVLAARLAGYSDGDRPLWRDLDQVRALWEERRPLYGRSTTRVPVAAEDSVDCVVDRVVASLGDGLCST